MLLTRSHSEALRVPFEHLEEQVREATPYEAEARRFETEPPRFELVTRRKTHDRAALGVVALLYAAGLATGVWMTYEVGKGLAIAERCDGRCVEPGR